MKWSKCSGASGKSNGRWASSIACMAGAENGGSSPFFLLSVGVVVPFSIFLVPGITRFSLRHVVGFKSRGVASWTRRGNSWNMSKGQKLAATQVSPAIICLFYLFFITIFIIIIIEPGLSRILVSKWRGWFRRSCTLLVADVGAERASRSWSRSGEVLAVLRSLDDCLHSGRTLKPFLYVARRCWSY